MIELTGPAVVGFAELARLAAETSARPVELVALDAETLKNGLLQHGVPDQPSASRAGLVLFAPDAESFLNRPIGKAEQDGIGLRFVRYRIPGRRDKDIVFLPVELVIANLGAALAFNDTEDRRIGRPIARSLKSRR